MRFVEVNKVPTEYLGRGRKDKKRLVDVRLQEFMGMNVKVVRVEYESGEYAYPGSCRTSMYRAVRASGLPIHVIMVDGIVYLERTDM